MLDSLKGQQVSNDSTFNRTLSRRGQNLAVLRDLAPLLIALGVAAIIYILRETRRRRLRMNPSRPGLTMQEAWELCLQDSSKHPDGVLIPAALQPEAVPAAAVKRLFELEGRCLEADNPRVAVREAVLENAVIALHLEAISELGEPERAALLRGYAEGMDQLLRDAWTASTLQWIVLRLYSRLKYDDAVAGDWFHHFMHVARPYIREKVRLAREFVLRMDEGSGRFVEIYDSLLQELRREMLKARPKRRFAAPDLP